MQYLYLKNLYNLQEEHAVLQKGRKSINTQ